MSKTRLEYLVITLMILCFVAVLSGCASTEPYVDIGLGYQQASTTITRFRDGARMDHSDRAYLAIGLQWKYGRCEIAHNSSLSSGPPFNSEADFATDTLQCIYRISRRNYE
jgi:hypothetical protein